MTTVGADITVEEDVQRIREAAGDIDILVNNAAIYPSEPWQTVSLESWHEVFKVNLTPRSGCARSSCPSMMERGWGRVINIASVYGQTGPETAALSRHLGAVLVLREQARDQRHHPLPRRRASPAMA